MTRRHTLRSLALPPAMALAVALATGGCRESTSPPVPRSPGAAEGGSNAGAAAAGAPLEVVAINSPLACFAARIGGDLVSVSMPVPADRDPAWWAPRSEDILRMQNAGLIILNGAGHERWRSSAALPESRVVDTAAAFKDRWIETKEGTTHSHGLEGEHTHKGTAFTTWIDPELAIAQADAIRAALTRALPASGDRFAANFAVLKGELEEIDRSLEGAIHGQQSLPIVFSHPVYDYLIRRYALNGRMVHWEPDEMPPESEWTSLATLLKEHPARWMVWEDEPSEAIRTRLAAMGVECVVFSPGGNLGPNADALEWCALQRRNAIELARVYE